MEDKSMWQSSFPTKGKSRSMGMKLIVVCGLALLMTIPTFFVSGLVEERTHRAADVVKEISAHVGGQQTFLGPLSQFRTPFRRSLPLPLQSMASISYFRHKLQRRSKL